MESKYSIELFKPGGDGAGIEEVLDRHDNLTVARSGFQRSRERWQHAASTDLHGAVPWKIKR
jgi:hypothetical protein